MSEPARSLGGSLRVERERREMSIDEISQTTRIPRRALLSLEEGNFDELPADVFVRGYLRAYASTVGMDPEPVVRQFDSQRPLAAKSLDFSRVAPDRTPLGWRVAFATLMLFAVLVVAFAAMGRPPAPQAPIELSSVIIHCPPEQNKRPPCSSALWTTATPIASSHC